MALTPTAVKTANYTAKKNELVLCNPTAGGFGVLMPMSPANGTQVGIQLTANAATPNVVTAASNQIPSITGHGFAGAGIVSPPEVHGLAFTAVGPVTLFTYSTTTQLWTVT